MVATLLITRLALAAVFGTAGVAKLMDGSGSRRSLKEFGVPRALIWPIAVGLPIAELACAFALLRASTAWVGAVGAAALLMLFIAAIVINLARGRTPDCQCFGKLHSEPVGWMTVLRNVVLGAAAGVVIWQGPGGVGPGLFEWLGMVGRPNAMYLGLWMFAVMLAVFGGLMLVQLLAQNGRMMLRIEALEAKLGAQAGAEKPMSGLPVGDNAPSFALLGLDGNLVALDALRQPGRSILLFFSEPGCAACEAMLPDVAAWQRDDTGRLLVVPIGRGGLEVNRVKSATYGLDHVLVEADREVGDLYKVQVTPSAVLVKDGLIASPMAQGPEEIRALVFDVTLATPVKKADLAPSLKIRDVDGKLADLVSPQRPTVLLFWNPSCGFCASMLKDVKSWERTRSRSAPELVVVSAGMADANRAQGFRARVLLDQSFGVGRVFGATGTPSAVLIDVQGRVSSDVVVGAEAVMGLLQGAQRPDAVPA